MRRGLALGGAVLAGLLPLACGGGSSSTPAAWAASHSQPASMTFLGSDEAGLCAVTARYPNEAPAAISFQGKTYAQSDRSGAPAAPPGVELDHTGDWHIFQAADGSLVLVMPRQAFTYRLGKC